MTTATEKSATAKTERKTITINFEDQAPEVYEAITKAALIDDRTAATWVRRFLIAQHKAGTLK